jgi:hypothetical protein
LIAAHHLLDVMSDFSVPVSVDPTISAELQEGRDLH